jgi:hypothetical protein|tara:strand:- start:808 stop:1134 length:327 start_codon:yes stop_codon:yes gene_type:complete
MFYIYENSTTYIIGKPDRNGVAHPDHRQYYKTMSAAKAGLTRIKKAENLLPTDPNFADFRYAIAEAEYFHKNIEASRKAKNLMSGEWFVEPINTPGYMSPARESYWSM